MKKFFKYLLWAFAIYFVVALIYGIIMVVNTTPEQVNSVNTTTEQINSLSHKEVQINIDSIVNLIKSDKLFEIKDVYYNPHDSSLNIAFTNKGGVIKNGEYSPNYFNSAYNLNMINCVDGPYLYEYKKGKSLNNGDYKEYLTCSSKRAAKLMEIFKDNFCVRDIECTALTGFLKKQLNDPDSYKSDKIFVEWLHDDHFLVTNIFRAKNAFGALVLNKCSCEFDINGNGYNFKFIE